MEIGRRGPLAPRFCHRGAACGGDRLLPGTARFRVEEPLAEVEYATEGDAIMFAVGLYLDMLNIFLALLQLLSILSGNGGSSRRSDW